MKDGPPLSIVVIGAGVGGLSAAIRLAHQGYPVTVLEKNTQVGGKLNRLQVHGFTWDTGPSLITMPQVFHALFSDVGRKLEDYLRLEPIDPICHYRWSDGVEFDAWTERDRLIEEIARLSPRDVAGFERFMAYAQRLYQITAEPFLFNPPLHWRDWLRLPLMDVLRIDAFRTVDRSVSRYFRDPHLRQLFNRFATYVGSSPYQAPATLNIIPYVELALGGWYLRGGLYTLAQALQRLAEEVGVTIRTACPVQRILVESGKVKGVMTEDGTVIPADLVVANSDVPSTYERLLAGAPGLPMRVRLAQLEPSCSGFILMLGVRHPHPQLGHHNIFFSNDYPAEFRDIFVRRVAPADPTIYLCISSKTDPALAPPGCENWFVLINAPYLSAAFDWQRSAQAYGDQIIEMLESRWGLAGLRDNIVARETWTPADLAERFSAYRGAIYGISSNRRSATFLRPPTRSPDVKGLYFVGGSTHPGGGVPLVLLSGQIVANRIGREWKIGTPSK